MLIVNASFIRQDKTKSGKRVVNHWNVQGMTFNVSDFNLVTPAMVREHKEAPRGGWTLQGYYDVTPARPVEIPPRLIRAVVSVWQAIGHDVLLDRLEFDQPDNEEVIEMCLDCDRLNPRSGFHEDAEAYADYQALKEQHGYHTLRKLLAAHPQLQLA